MGTLSLKEVLYNHNCEGKVYLSDIAMWLGDKVYFSISGKDRTILQDKLTEMKTKKER